MSASLLARLSAVTTVMLSLFWIHAGLGGWSTRGGPVYFNWHITLAIVAVACVLLGRLYTLAWDAVLPPLLTNALLRIQRVQNNGIC